MNAAVSSALGLAPDAVRQRLEELLFPDRASGWKETVPLTTYAVLDGASVRNLLDELYANDGRPEFVCLFRGDLEPDIAEVAPYLVRLEAGSAFTDWLLANCWGNHFGIFVRSTAGIELLRRHFRKFLRVKSPEGKVLYFRYYDPRVLKVYLPTCVGAETETLFGPIQCYVAEDENTSQALVFTVKEGRVVCKEHPLYQQTNRG